MKTFTFDVTRRVTVTLDELKFNTGLMEDFNTCITDLGTDEHAYLLHGERIARLYAFGIVDFLPHQFVEGYGPVREAGIAVNTNDNYEYIERIFPQAKGGAA